MRAPTGRFVCGKLCPLGLAQDVCYLFPSPAKIQTFPGDKQLRYLKGGILMLWAAVNIMGLAAESRSSQFFNPNPILLAGSLIGTTAICTLICRPLCRYLCPAGLIFGWGNKLPIGQLHVNASRCNKCRRCEKVCPMGIVPYQEPNSIECVRCGKCVKACRRKALYFEKDDSVSKND